MAGANRGGAAGKKAPAKTSAPVKRQQNKGGGAKGANRAKKQQPAGEPYQDTGLRDEIVIIASLLGCVLLVLSYFNICGIVGDWLNTAVFGLLGIFGYIFPFAMFFTILFAISNRGNRYAMRRVIYGVVMMVFVAALIQMALGGYDGKLRLLDYFTHSALSYKGILPSYGGLLGGMICMALCPLVGNVAAVCIIVAVILILFMLLSGKAVFAYIRRRMSERRCREKPEPEIYEEDDAPDAERSIGGGGQTPRRRIKLQSPVVLERVPSGGEEPGVQEDFVERLKKRGRSMGAGGRQDGPGGLEDVQEAAFELEEISRKYSINSRGITEEDEGGEALDSIYSQELKRKFGGRQELDIPVLRRSPYAGNISYADGGLQETQGGRDVSGLTSGTGDAGGKIIRLHSYMKDDARDDDGELSPAVTDENVTTRLQPCGDVQDGTEQQAQPEGSRPGAVSVTAGAQGDGGLQTPENTEDPADGAAPSGGPDAPCEAEAAGMSQPAGRQEGQTAAEDDIINIEQDDAGEEKKYVFPPITLLTKSKKSAKGVSEKELRETAAKLESVFESFGVGVTVTDVSCGPTVTRYELHPEQGVKVSRITGLADDIKLNLAAADIRIEAPIPGKAAVGIEIPNKENVTVLLRDLLESDEFTKHKSSIAFAVGKDIAGKTVVTDIAKMPHLLIAGATGSGKSVCINTLIMSILYKASPYDVKLIMVDPKVVELNVYNGIPHLLIPVVTDPKKASAALNWAVVEMTNRYKIFAELGVRDLKGYNEKADELVMGQDGADGAPVQLPNRLPQIVIIVDELADLMMVAPGEVEDAICRLAQLARAAGIHLIIATQRPSVNVITGLIKANIPSRVAFAVSSAIDSRTIIDSGGAEKLLGRGDMLFFPSGYPKPVRLQGAFVTDKEVTAVVEFLKSQGKQEAVYSEEVANQIASVELSAETPSSAGDRDEYFADAARFIIEKDKASIGMLQRVYKIGFNRAARIMDQLSEAGVVGPEEGTKPRKILMSAEEFEAFISDGR